MKTDYHENLTREDKEFRHLLVDLKTTDVPEDFGFRVKAKIARASSTGSKSGIFLFLKVAIPLSLLLFVGFFAANRFFVQENKNALAQTAPEIKVNEAQVNPIVSTGNPEITDAVVANASNGTTQIDLKPPPEVASAIPAKSNLPKVRMAANKEKAAKLNPEDDRIRERILSQTDAVNPIKPKGFDQKAPIENPGSETAKVDIKQVLTELGIDADEANEKWVVKSVKKNSVADVSGVQASDIIQSFDDQKLLPKETRVKSFSGKFLTVVRNGKAVELKLQY